MSAAGKNYTIGYFFATMHPTHADKFAQFLLKGLRTQDPNMPEGNQPSLVEGAPNTVAFIENVNSIQLRGIGEHIKQLTLSSLAAFWDFSDKLDGKGVLGMTVYFKDDQDRKAMMVTQSQEDSRDEVAFAYQVGFEEGIELTPDMVIPMPNGKSCLEAVLAYFGELSNVTGESTH